MADIDRRAAYRKLKRWASDNGFPSLDEWVDVNIIKRTPDATELTIEVESESGNVYTAQLERDDVTINEIFAARNDPGNRTDFDPGDINIDSPTRGAKRGAPPITSEDIEKAIEKADKGRGGIPTTPTPEPTITDKILRGVRRFINRLRARF